MEQVPPVCPYARCFSVSRGSLPLGQPANPFVLIGQQHRGGPQSDWHRGIVGVQHRQQECLCIAEPVLTVWRGQQDRRLPRSARSRAGPASAGFRRFGSHRNHAHRLLSFPEIRRTEARLLISVSNSREKNLRVTPKVRWKGPQSKDLAPPLIPPCSQSCRRRVQPPRALPRCTQPSKYILDSHIHYIK